MILKLLKYFYYVVKLPIIVYRFYIGPKFDEILSSYLLILKNLKIYYSIKIYYYS